MLTLNFEFSRKILIFLILISISFSAFAQDKKPADASNDDKSCIKENDAWLFYWKSEYKEVADAAKALCKQYGDLSTKYKTDVDSLNQKIAAQDLELTDLRNQKNQNDTKIASLESQIQSLKSKSDRSFQDTETLSKEVQVRTIREKELTEKVTTIQTNINTLTQELQTEKARADKLAEENARTRAELDNYKKSSNNATTPAKVTSQSVGANSTSETNTTTTITTNTTTVVTDEQKIKQLESEKAKLEAENKNIKKESEAKLVSLQKDLSEYKNLIDRLQKENEALGKDNKDLLSDLASLKDLLTQENLKYKEELDKLKKQQGKKGHAKQEKIISVQSKVPEVEAKPEPVVESNSPNKRGKVILSLPASVTFKTGSDKLKPGGKKVLDKFAQNIAKHSGGRFNIEGNTDDRPIKNSRFENNWELSISRAISVLHYLVRVKKLDEELFTVSASSSNNPIRPNDSEEGRAANRRVDIIFSSDKK